MLSKTPVELSGSDDEGAARAVIEQAGGVLSLSRNDIPAGFVGQIYARAAPEDVVRYGAGDLAALAERAYDFIAERQPGAPKVRCETVKLHTSGGHKAVTVIDMINDDMPFLVDSVMGEIADRRLDVRLVSHPGGDLRNRQFRAHAVQAVGDGEHAGGFGAGMTSV